MGNDAVEVLVNVEVDILGVWQLHLAVVNCKRREPEKVGKLESKGGGVSDGDEDELKRSPCQPWRVAIALTKTSKKGQPIEDNAE